MAALTIITSVQRDCNSVVRRGLLRGLLRGSLRGLLRGSAWLLGKSCNVLCEGGNRQTEIAGTSTIHYCIKHEIT